MTDQRRYPWPNPNHASASPASWATRARNGVRASVAGPPRPPPPCNNVAARATLQRNVPMLARRIPVALGLQRPQRVDQAGTRVAGIDDVVEKTARRRFVGVSKLLPVLGLALLGRLALIEDLHRPFGTHHSNLRGGPSHVVIPTDVLGIHHVVGAAIRLASDNRQLRDGGLAVGVEQFGTMLDDAAVLLGHARQEAGDILEGDERDVERV